MPRILLAPCLLLVGLMPAAVRAESPAATPPLHERIDRELEGGFVTQPSDLAGDDEFLRRTYLVLTGTIPTGTEARQFLNDTSPHKRTALIDRLLNSPEFSRHMAVNFDVMLMERRADKHVKTPEWRQYLLASFEANKPYDQLAREILGADGVDAKLRAAAKFYLDRDGEVNLLTRDVGRKFFGMDLQCAQCHDHPLISDYYQSDYYGIFAFLNRSFVFADKKAKKSFFAEKAEGQVTFKSVFTEESGATGPRLPGGVVVQEPTFKKDEAYAVKPAKDVRPVPKFSRRAQLAKLATSGNNRAFNRNIANRLWAQVMGRGLVEPVDLHHEENPSASPALTEMLGNELAAMKFDMRAFMRELLLTRTFQRSLDLPANLAQQAEELRGQLAAAETQTDGCEKAFEAAKGSFRQRQEAASSARKSHASITEKATKLAAALAESKKQAAAAQVARDTTQKSLTARQPLAVALAEVAGESSELAKKFPQEKSLAEAAKTFQQRAQTVGAEVSKLSATLAEQTQQWQMLTDKITIAERELTSTQAMLVVAKQQADAAETELAAAAAVRQAAAHALTTAQRRAEDTRALVAYADLHQRREQALTNSQQQAAEHQAAAQRATASRTSLANAEQDTGTAQKTRDEIRLQVAQSQERLKQQQAAQRLLAEATTQADAARKQLAQDAQLAAASEALHAQLERISNAARQTQSDMTQLNKGMQQAESALERAQQMRSKMQTESTTADAELARRKEELTRTRTSLKDVEASYGETQTAVTERLTRRFAVNGLTPLTPEQLAWSMMRATGFEARQRVAATAELDKKQPLDAAARQDPAKMAARAKAIEASVQDKLKGHVAAFVNLFGGGAGQPQNDFFATVNQALFFANGGQMRSWLAASGDNLSGRLIKEQDPAKLADDLYLNVLTRRPDPVEVQDIAAYLAPRAKDRPAAVQELVWGLLTSSEFRFNH